MSGTSGVHEAAARALEESRTTGQVPFQTLIEQVPGILYVAELGLGGRWLYVSPQVEDLLGWSAEEWLADPTLFARALHPDDRDAETDSERPEHTVPGERHLSEYRLITRNGGQRWFRDDARLLADDRGQPVGWSGVLTDVTEQRRSEHLLRRSDQRARTIIDTALDAYVAIDARGAICDWNPTAEQTFGWTREEILGRRLSDTIMPERFVTAHEAGLQAALDKDDLGLGRILEFTARCRNGTELKVELTVWRSDEEDGACFSAFIRDITERTRLQAQLTERAYRDPLTGLANRALFQQRLGEHVAGHAARFLTQAVGHPATGGFIVLIVGLDDFRATNISLGPEAADELVHTVARRLTAHAPVGSFVARLSDDEFAVLVPDVPSAAEAQRIGHWLPINLRAAPAPGDRELTVRVSIGVRHCAASDTGAVEELLSDAGTAMVTAARSGRAVALFETSMRAASLRRLHLTAALEHAVERDEIYVVYQPYFSLTDGRACGVEALARWQHPVYGEVSPSEFILLAETAGQIQALGMFVLSQACRDIAALRGEGEPHTELALSINVSARQLVDGRLQQELSTVLAETGLPGDALMLELTETALVEDELDVAERLRDIRGLGVHLAVDDFGTKYASLAYLQRFPIDTLKVDRSFVQWVHQSPDEQRLTGAIITLAKTLGLRTIAEGIEEGEAVQQLSGLGCDAGQGFLFARPVRLDRLGAVLWAGERRVSNRLVGIN